MVYSADQAGESAALTRVSPKEWFRVSKEVLTDGSSHEYSGIGHGLSALEFKSRGDTTIYGFMWTKERKGRSFKL